jgi:hypothetical protein
MIIHITGYPHMNLPVAEDKPPAGKFSLGRTVATPGALDAVPDDEMQAALRRHYDGDWGDLCEADRAENERSLREGYRLLSVYRTKAGVRFYVITEHDRSVTTVLLPEEY